MKNKVKTYKLFNFWKKKNFYSTEDFFLFNEENYNNFAILKSY